MAHLEKYTIAAAGRLTAYYEQRHKKNGVFINYGNQNIDVPRIPQNYNLGPVREASQIDFIRQRCSEVQCMDRKDVNVMCDWIVTAPANLPQEDHKRFFEETYNFLENRYGKDNVISAYVHMDEKSPHIHFAFIPVIFDRKKHKDKVSAKELISRRELKSFHPDLEGHLKHAFGREVGILNDATREGNRSIEELRRRTAADRLRDVEEQVQLANQMIQEKAAAAQKEIQESLRQKQDAEEMAARLNEITREVEEKVQAREKLELEIDRLSSLVRAEQDKLRRFHNMVGGCALSMREIQAIQPKKAVSGLIKGITLEDVINLKKTALLYRETLEALRHSQEQCEFCKTGVDRCKQKTLSIDEPI